MLLLAPAAAVAQGGPALEPLLLGVSVNGQPAGEPQLLLRDADGGAWASAAALKGWRLHLPAAETTTFEGETYYRLASSSLRATLSAADQSLAIDADPALFETQTNSLRPEEQGEMTASATGGFVNYDIFAEHSFGATRLNGAFELGLFTAHGVGATTFVGGLGAGRDQLTRLESNWTIDRPGGMVSLRLGDGVSAGSPSAAPVRFAGVQFARNFAIRPGYVTLPLPGVSGSAALPSIVDIYVDSVKQGSREVAPGPFDVTGIPLQSGGGSLQLVVTDLLGRETVATQSYYVSSALLARGLHDFSYEAGFLRRDFGARSNAYGAPMASATHRYGLSDAITAEAYAQATAKRQLGGLGLATVVRHLGALSASATVSRSERGAGRAATLGLERRMRSLSLGLRAELASARFASVGMAGGERPAKLSTQAFVDFPIPSGSVGFNYLRRDNRGRADESLAGAFASFALGRAGTLQLFARRSTIGRAQTTIGAYFAIPLGGRRSAAASVEHSRGRQLANLSFQKDPPPGEGSGYRASATLGATDSFDAIYSIATATASYGAQAGYGRGGGAARLSAAGAIGLIGDTLFASRRLGASFGAVKLAGLPGVRVYADNQLIGVTDRAGAVIVPSLRAFEANRISVDDADLPMDVQLAETEISIRPYARAGALIAFAVKRERGAMLRVSLEDGNSLPAGARVFAPGGGAGFVTAPGGEVYIPDLAGTAELRAAWNGQSCTIAVVVPANDDPQPRIEGLVCKKAVTLAAR